MTKDDLTLVDVDEHIPEPEHDRIEEALHSGVALEDLLPE